MATKRPSYRWEALIRKASTPTDGAGKPLRSCLKKKTSSPVLLGRTDDHSLIEEKVHHEQRQPPRQRRPSKTLSLDADADILFGGMTRSASATCPSLENITNTRIARRQRRRRRSRQKIDVPTLGETGTTTVKGILRTSSDPPKYKPKKSVSFSDLDRCRWNSETSLNMAGGSKASDAARNFVWEAKEGKRSSILRTESMNGMGRLLKQQSNRQAPSRPARRGSNDHSNDKGDEKLHVPPHMPTRTNSWGDSEKPPRAAADTVNIFQAAVSDFQASVRRTELAKARIGDSKGPSLPQRAPSYDSSVGEDSTRESLFEGSLRSRLQDASGGDSICEADNLSEGSVRISMSDVSKGELAPTKPSRRRSMEQASKFQGSINNGMYSQPTSSEKVHAPPGPNRYTELDKSLSRSPKRRDVFQAKVNEFQCSLIGSLCAKQTNLSGGADSLADHSLAA